MPNLFRGGNVVNIVVVNFLFVYVCTPALGHSRLLHSGRYGKVPAGVWRASGGRAWGRGGSH